MKLLEHLNLLIAAMFFFHKLEEKRGKWPVLRKPYGILKEGRRLTKNKNKKKSAIYIWFLFSLPKKVQIKLYHFLHFLHWSKLQKLTDFNGFK